MKLVTRNIIVVAHFLAFCSGATATATLGKGLRGSATHEANGKNEVSRELSSLLYLDTSVMGQSQKFDCRTTRAYGQQVAGAGDAYATCEPFQGKWGGQTHTPGSATGIFNNCQADKCILQCHRGCQVTSVSGDAIQAASTTSSGLSPGATPITIPHVPRTWPSDNNDRDLSDLTYWDTSINGQSQKFDCRTARSYNQQVGGDADATCTSIEGGWDTLPPTAGTAEGVFANCITDKCVLQCHKRCQVTPISGDVVQAASTSSSSSAATPVTNNNVPRNWPN